MPRIDYNKLLFSRRRFKKPAVLVATILLIALGYEEIPMLPEPYTGDTKVIDGDTLEIQNQRFRLFGIDAPETSQTCKKHGIIPYSCGKEATRALAKIISQQPVTCEQKDIDSYHRIVAICYAGNIELNRWMVANGHALAYRHYSTRYSGNEKEAKAAGLGVWQGAFQTPWEYRHGTP